MLNRSWNSVVRNVGGLKPQIKWVLGRGGGGGHHPHLVDSKLRLREVCHYQLVSGRTSTGTQIHMCLGYSMPAESRESHHPVLLGPGLPVMGSLQIPAL